MMPPLFGLGLVCCQLVIIALNGRAAKGIKDTLVGALAECGSDTLP